MSGMDKDLSGAAGGIRTHDIQNHNLALLPTELQPPQSAHFNIRLHQADRVYVDHQSGCFPLLLLG
jgi:hypothetical protein